MATKKTDDPVKKPAKKPAAKKVVAKKAAAKKPAVKKAAAKKPAPKKTAAKKPAVKKAATKKAAPKKAAPQPEQVAPPAQAQANTPPVTPPAQPTPQAQNGEMAQPMLRILAQYIKDVSFENPNAPDSLRQDQSAPAININIEVARNMVDENTVEVALMLGAKAERNGQTIFLCELEYAGLFAFGNISEEHVQPMILIECPRLLFPFARQIMAELTQNGGYPPILLEPPDFAAMFRDEMMRRAQQAGGTSTVN